MAPDRACPIQLEMSQPRRDPHQRRTTAVHRESDTGPVGRSTKSDLSHDPAPRTCRPSRRYTLSHPRCPKFARMGTVSDLMVFAAIDALAVWVSVAGQMPITRSRLMT